MVQYKTKYKVLGSKTYVHIPTEEQFDSMSKPMILIKYIYNGYKLWDTEKEKIVRARNVDFDETVKTAEIIEIKIDTENQQSVNDKTRGNLQQEDYRENENKEKGDSTRRHRKTKSPLQFEKL